MKNFIQEGRIIEFTAPADVVSGVPLLIGELLVVPCVSALSGAKFNAAVEGVYELPSDTGTAYSEGDLLYWDDTGKTVTKTVGTNKVAGYAAAAKASAGTLAAVKLWR